MGAARPPGWYDEPSGDRALLRWWDGEAWTGITRQRSAYEPAAAETPGADRSAAGPPADLLDSGERRAGPRRGALLALLAVAVVGLLLITGVPGLTVDPDRGRLADRGSRPTEPTDPRVVDPPYAPPSPIPVSGRVTDPVARLSYDVLPGAWRAWDRGPFSGLLSTAGYYRIVQDGMPGGDIYWANVTSGQVNPGTASRDDLRSTAARLADTLARDYYPKHTRREVSQRELHVDGAPAYLLRYRAVFDPSAAGTYTAKSELVIVLLVDTGDDLPAALYVSLPDTVRALWPSVDALLASVRVVR